MRKTWILRAECVGKASINVHRRDDEKAHLACSSWWWETSLAGIARAEVAGTRKTRTSNDGDWWTGPGRETPRYDKRLVRARKGSRAGGLED